MTTPEGKRPRLVAIEGDGQKPEPRDPALRFGRITLPEGIVAIRRAVHDFNLVPQSSLRRPPRRWLVAGAVVLLALGFAAGALVTLSHRAEPAGQALQGDQHVPPATVVPPPGSASSAPVLPPLDGPARSTGPAVSPPARSSSRPVPPPLRRQPVRRPASAPQAPARAPHAPGTLIEKDL